MKKSVFITGAAMGIGKAIAQLFISKGWSVGIVDVNEVVLKNTLAELGDNAKGYVGSVTNTADISDALTSFTDLHEGKLDLLINNAGIIHTGEFLEMDFDDNEAIVQINLIGLMRVTKLAFPYLKRAKTSKIINLASISSVTGIPRVATYAATKSAVKSLTESFYVSFKKHGIAVTSIIPHLVSTRMVAQNIAAFGVKGMKDAKSSPAQVAKKVWTAYQGNKVHYPISLDAWALYLASGILPTKWLLGLVKRIVKY